MPGLNGTGPRANGPMGGRGFGRCLRIVAPAQESAALVQQVNEESGTAISQESAQNNSVFGRGRGGFPRGCGRGFGFGGGRRHRG